MSETDCYVSTWDWTWPGAVVSLSVFWLALWWNNRGTIPFSSVWTWKNHEADVCICFWISLWLECLICICFWRELDLSHILIMCFNETACLWEEISGDPWRSNSSTSQHWRRAICWNSSRYLLKSVFNVLASLTEILQQICTCNCFFFKWSYYLPVPPSMDRVIMFLQIVNSKFLFMIGTLMLVMRLLQVWNLDLHLWH